MFGKIKSKYGRKTFIYNISKKENINRLEADRLYQPVPITLAKMEVDANNNKKFMYDVSFCVSLKEYFRQCIETEKILDFLSQFIAMSNECEKLKLSIDKVVLDDFKYVFYNETSGQLKFIYIPVQNIKIIHNEDTLRKFVVNLLSTPIYKNDADMTKISRILEYIHSELHFNIKSLESVIDKIKSHQKETIQTDTSEFEKSKRYMSVKPENMSSESVQQQNVVENLSTDFATTDMINADNEDNEDNEDFATVDTLDLADEFLTQDTIIYEGVLERLLTNEEIIISKTPFTIGRYNDRMPASIIKPDYCLDATEISRSHIIIFQKSGKESEQDIFEIYDEHSRNRTFINGILLEYKQYLRLSDGDEIKLPGETFVFHIREK